MVGVFDHYAKAAFNSVENIMGESITFISESGSFPDTVSSGIVDNVYPEIDEFGNTIIVEAYRVTVSLENIPAGFMIGDSIRFNVNGSPQTFEVINTKPDVNASKVFYLSE
jgi:hypothetical protein